MSRNLKHIHRLLASFLGLFIITHLAVHLTALGGAETHQNILTSIQGIYRNKFVEPVLVLAILMQVYVGIRLYWRRRKLPRQTKWMRIQSISGLYLAFFLLVHSSAAISTRHLFGLDTDFYWAAGTLNIEPLKYGFAPYYFLGVSAFFAHIAAALSFKRSVPNLAPKFIIVLGLVVAATIIATFAGAFYEITLPQAVIDNFEKYLP